MLKNCSDGLIDATAGARVPRVTPAIVISQIYKILILIFAKLMPAPQNLQFRG